MKPSRANILSFVAGALAASAVCLAVLPRDRESGGSKLRGADGSIIRETWAPTPACDCSPAPTAQLTWATARPLPTSQGSAIAVGDNTGPARSRPPTREPTPATAGENERHTLYPTAPAPAIPGPEAPGPTPGPENENGPGGVPGDSECQPNTAACDWRGCYASYAPSEGMERCTGGMIPYSYHDDTDCRPGDACGIAFSGDTYEGICFTGTHATVEACMCCDQPGGGWIQLIGNTGGQWCPGQGVVWGPDLPTGTSGQTVFVGLPECVPVP